MFGEDRCFPSFFPRFLLFFLPSSLLLPVFFFCSCFASLSFFFNVCVFFFWGGGSNDWQGHLAELKEACRTENAKDQLREMQEVKETLDEFLALAKVRFSFCNDPTSPSRGGIRFFQLFVALCFVSRPISAILYHKICT